MTVGGGWALGCKGHMVTTKMKQKIRETHDYTKTRKINKRSPVSTKQVFQSGKIQAVAEQSH